MKGKQVSAEVARILESAAKVGMGNVPAQAILDSMHAVLCVL